MTTAEFLLQTKALISIEATELSSYGDFSLEKFIHLILYFATNGMLKTKLMKLLWYSDFLYFKRQTVSITGTTYVNYP